MGKHTEIKKINMHSEYIDYEIFDNDVVETLFFIRIVMADKILLCSTSRKFCDYFYLIDLKQPNYKSIPLMQNNVSSRVFIRAVSTIIRAIENDPLVDNLSINN